MNPVWHFIDGTPNIGALRVTSLGVGVAPPAAGFIQAAISVTTSASGVIGIATGGALSADQNLIMRTAPTIGSGFGTSPSVVASNGTAAFTVNVGTGGTATSGVITMPTAANGWSVFVENRTGTLGNYANQRTVCIASTTTSITLENQTISTGAALAWTASDVLVVTAIAY